MIASTADLIRAFAEWHRRRPTSDEEPESYGRRAALFFERLVTELRYGHKKS